MLNYTSTGCPVTETLPHDPTPFFSNGEIHFKAHDVGWIVCGVCTIIASSMSMWLISKHLSFFYHPTEQRYIVRLLFMPIIYAICSFLSYYFYHQALIFQLLRDCYEALVIASFFFLLVSYLSNPVPTPAQPHPQPFSTRAERNAQLRSVLKDLHFEKWAWPLGRWRCKPDGESFLWWMRVCVGQYVVVRPLSTLASVVGELTGHYCLASYSPKFVHVWSSAAVSISVTVAMYAVIQLYVSLKMPLAPYSPLLKAACVKLVVFFMFWQESGLSLLTTVGVIRSRTYWSAEEICVGLAALLACFEMVVFAFLHVKAFSYLPYRSFAAPTPLDGPAPRLLTDKTDDGGEDDEKDSLLDPSASLTFAEWDARERKFKARQKALDRLAKTKLPKGVEGLPPTKADGSPLLQQTRKWPAFLYCINPADIGRELVQEVAFIFRGGKLDESEERLLDVRRDDLEAALGRKREDGRARGGYETGERDETSFERDLRRLRDCGTAPSGARVGADGSLLFPPSDPLVGRTARQQSRWAGEESWGRGRMGERGKPLWESKRGQKTSERGFEQLPRIDYSSLPVAGVPTLDTNSSTITIPPAHRISPRTSSTPLEFASSLVTPSLRQPSTRAPPSQPSSRPTTRIPSDDSGQHLPSELFRPTSYVPPPLTTPSPPPFAYFSCPSSSASRPPSPPLSPFMTPQFRTISPTLPTSDDAFTTYTRPSQRSRRSHDYCYTPTSLPTLPTPARPSTRSHSHSQSVPVASSSTPPMLAFQPPPKAVLPMVSAESRMSRGLPPGAQSPRS